MKEIHELVILSKYAGERFDLVQAGGGNSSVKLPDGTMFIKASGYQLSELTESNGVSQVDNNQILSIIRDVSLRKMNKKEREKNAHARLSNAILKIGLRPSIETFLHALTNKYTLHTHPIAINAITNCNDWKEILINYFPNALFVPYETPGIELALRCNDELESYIKKNNKRPYIIFLQNHGLIISSDKYEDIKNITDYVVSKAAQSVSYDLSKYRLTNSISFLINIVFNNLKICYLSEDAIITKLIKTSRSDFFSFPFCPDKLVYCGISAVELNSLTDSTSIREYLKIYFEMPKVVIWKNFVFFIADNIKKAKEIEEVFKFHLLSIVSHSGKVSFLDLDELNYLNNWEAEIYRKKL